MRALAMPESDPEEDLREYYGLITDQIMNEALTFGGDTALNLYNLSDGAPTSGDIGEAREMMLAAFAAKLRYRGAPDGVVAPACREADRAFDEILHTLLADATPGVTQ